MENKRGIRQTDRHERRRTLHGASWPGRPRATGVCGVLHKPGDGTWSQMTHALTHHFKADEAWLLCYLANLERTAIKLPPKYRRAGWFYCTGRKVRCELGLGDDKQKLVFSKLRDKGFIETKQKFRVDENGAIRGHHPIRWVRINHTAITAAVDAAKYPALADEGR